MRKIFLFFPIIAVLGAATMAVAQQPNILRMARIRATATSSHRVEALAQSQGQATLIVRVTGLRSEKGQVRIAVFNSSENWLSKKATYSSTLNAEGQSVTARINDVPEGDYAIAVFHDENSNGEMDKNFLGMPLEPYGFSNNVRVTLGPPKWEDLKFAVKRPTTEVSIEVK